MSDETDLRQIGWRNARGFCFGHDHHHPLDGIERCWPVYERISEAVPSVSDEGEQP